MGGMGTITIGNGLANIGGAYDDVTPRAYEENSDGMKTAGALDSIGTLMDGNAILYASPSFDVGGGSASFKFAYHLRTVTQQLVKVL